MKTRTALAGASIAALIAAGGVSYGFSDPGSPALGPLTSILGAVVLGHVKNNAALASLPARLGRVRRDGFATAGDGGSAEYTLSATPCTAADGGAQVPLNGGGCAVADFGGKSPSILVWGCKGDSVLSTVNGITQPVSGQGTANDTCLANAEAWAEANTRELFVPDGVFRLTAAAGGGNNMTFTGTGFDGGSLRGSLFFFDHAGYGFLTAGTWHFNNLGTVRAQPAPSSTAGTTYTPCACKFDFSSVQGELYIHDVFTENPTSQLEVQQGRLVVDGLRGQPLSVGIQVEDALDTVSIHRHRSWPYWSTNSNISDYTHKNRVDMNFGRVDNPELSDIFEFGSSTCMQFYTSTSASPLGGITSRLAATNWGCDDYGTNAITFASASDVSASFTNGYGFATAKVAGNGINGGNSNNINLNLTNLRFTNAAEANGDSAINFGGTGNVINASNFQIDGWGGVSGTPAIRIARGSFFYDNDARPFFSNCAHGQTSGCQAPSSPWFGGSAYTAQSQDLVPLPAGNGLLAISSGTNGPDALFLVAGGFVTAVTIPSNSPFVAITNGSTTATQENATNTPSNKISIGYYTDASTPGYFVYNNGAAVNLTYRLISLGQNN